LSLWVGWGDVGLGSVSEEEEKGEGLGLFERNELLGLGENFVELQLKRGVDWELKIDFIGVVVSNLLDGPGWRGSESQMRAVQLPLFKLAH